MDSIAEYENKRKQMLLHSVLILVIPWDPDTCVGWALPLRVLGPEMLNWKR